MGERFNEKEIIKKRKLEDILPEAKLKAKYQNEILTKDKRIERLESFIENNNLADKFNNQEKSNYRSYTFER